MWAFSVSFKVQPFSCHTKTEDIYEGGEVIGDVVWGLKWQSMRQVYIENDLLGLNESVKVPLFFNKVEDMWKSTNFCSHIRATCPLSYQGISSILTHALVRWNLCVCLDVLCWNSLTKEHAQSPLLLN